MEGQHWPLLMCQPQQGGHQSEAWDRGQVLGCRQQSLPQLGAQWGPTHRQHGRTCVYLCGMSSDGAAHLSPRGHPLPWDLGALKPGGGSVPSLPGPQFRYMFSESWVQFSGLLSELWPSSQA